MRDQVHAEVSRDSISENPYYGLHAPASNTKHSHLKTEDNLSFDIRGRIDSLLDEVHSIPAPVVDRITKKTARPDSKKTIAAKYGVTYSYLLARAKANPSVPLEELASRVRHRGPGANKFGRESEVAVAKLLSDTYGRSVSRTEKYHWPFDLLVDGWRIDVKAAKPRKTIYGTLSWTFNLKRRGVLNERADAYIFRMENIPGTRGAIHLFSVAPFRKANFIVSVRSLLGRYSWMGSDFYGFARGEMGARLEVAANA